MILTINEALRGKATRIKNKEYFETAAYLEPFLEIMSEYTDEFIIQAKPPTQVTKTKKGELDLDDITFNRMYIQAVLPKELSYDNHKEVIGMVYGLDVIKPVVKLFSGGLNMACTNLSVFNPYDLHTDVMEPESNINFSPLKRMLDNRTDAAEYLKQLSNIYLKREKRVLEKELGKWMYNSMINSYQTPFSKPKLSADIINKSFKSLFLDEDSGYYVEEGDDVSMFNVYNAFTDQICNKDKDIMNKAEKVLLLRNILEF